MSGADAVEVADDSKTDTRDDPTSKPVPPPEGDSRPTATGTKTNSRRSRILLRTLPPSQSPALLHFLLRRLACWPHRNRVWDLRVVNSNFDWNCPRPLEQKGFGVSS